MLHTAIGRTVSSIQTSCERISDAATNRIDLVHGVRGKSDEAPGLRGDVNRRLSIDAVQAQDAAFESAVIEEGDDGHLAVAKGAAAGALVLVGAEEVAGAVLEDVRALEAAPRPVQAAQAR